MAEMFKKNSVSTTSVVRTGEIIPPQQKLPDVSELSPLRRYRLQRREHRALEDIRTTALVHLALRTKEVATAKIDTETEETLAKIATNHEHVMRNLRINSFTAITDSKAAFNEVAMEAARKTVTLAETEKKANAAAAGSDQNAKDYLDDVLADIIQEDTELQKLLRKKVNGGLRQQAERQALDD